jgi:hypothetical protein
MVDSVVNNLSEMGIEIKLSKEGAKELAAILANGCPIKFELNEHVPIACPMWWRSTSCKACWLDFLKKLY